MHARYWECSYIHCNTPIQVQRANYAEKSSANNRPRKREKQGTFSVKKFRRFIYLKVFKDPTEQTPKPTQELEIRVVKYHWQKI